MPVWHGLTITSILGDGGAIVADISSFTFYMFFSTHVEGFSQHELPLAPPIRVRLYWKPLFKLEIIFKVKRLNKKGVKFWIAGIACTFLCFGTDLFFFLVSALLWRAAARSQDEISLWFFDLFHESSTHEFWRANAFTRCGELYGGWRSQSVWHPISLEARHGMEAVQTEQAAQSPRVMFGLKLMPASPFAHSGGALTFPSNLRGLSVRLQLATSLF